jgi:L-lactate utilization protein LutC
MSFLKRIFGSKKVTSKEVTKESNALKNAMLPEEDIESYDKQFVINFKKNGGKFIYVTTIDELQDALENIIEENQWLDVGCNNPTLNHLLKHKGLNMTTDFLGQDFIFIACEYLVADRGALVFSSKQIGEERLDKLPDNFIVYSTTSQLVRNIDKSMRSLKRKYKNNFPSNITTLKTFENIEGENDFRNYGNVSKNLYLLLLEDL